MYWSVSCDVTATSLCLHHRVCVVAGGLKPAPAGPQRGLPTIATHTASTSTLLLPPTFTALFSPPAWSLSIIHTPYIWPSDTHTHIYINNTAKLNTRRIVYHNYYHNHSVPATSPPLPPPRVYWRGVVHRSLLLLLKPNLGVNWLIYADVMPRD